MTCEICKTMTDQHDARFHELADRLAKIEAKPDVGTWIEDVERRVCELEAQLTLPTSSEGRMPSTALASAEPPPRTQVPGLCGRGRCVDYAGHYGDCTPNRETIVKPGSASPPRCKDWCGDTVVNPCHNNRYFCTAECCSADRPLNPAEKPTARTEPLPAEPPSEPAQACCDLHRDTGKDDAPCLWKLPDGSITSIPPAPSEPAKATVAERNFTPIVSGAPVLTTSEIEASWKRDHEPAKAPLSDRLREILLELTQLESRYAFQSAGLRSATNGEHLESLRCADLERRLAEAQIAIDRATRAPRKARAK